MIRIVYDNNVLISAILSKEPRASRKLVGLAAAGKVAGYTSKDLMAEFKEVIQRDFKVPVERTAQIVDMLLVFMKLIEPISEIKVVERDPKDDKVVSCAAGARAQYIASWDPHLTDLKEYNGIKILNPGKLLEELKQTHGIE